MTALNDLDEIEAEFLKQCGPCDAGLRGACVCSGRDFRPTMSRLVDEVATLRRVMLGASRRLHEKAEFIGPEFEAHQVMIEIARDLRAEAGQ